MADNLQNPVVAPLLKEARKRVYPKGQTILFPDDKIPDMFLIQQGAVMMHDLEEQGSRKILHIFGPPSMFPMVSFSAAYAISNWYYTALVDTTVYLMPYEEFKKHLENVDGVTAYNLLLKQLLDEVHELLIRIVGLSKTSSFDKLYVALQFLAKYHTKPSATNWHPVLFSVPHQLLADMTGLSRETVSITMKQLHDSKIARYPAAGKLELNCSRLLKPSN